MTTPFDSYGKSFDSYGEETPTTGQSPASGEGGGVDWADVGKGAVGGLGRGTAGLLGTGGTIGDLTRSALSKLGVPEGVLDAGALAARLSPFTSAFTGPSGRDLQQSAEQYTGKFYEPHTVPGQYASTVGEFAPGAVLPGGGGWMSRILNTVVPAVASETAGQMTKDSALEPWARGAAGLLAGATVPRLITPAPPPTAARQAAAAVFDREGIPMSAGERTGSNAVRWLEAVSGDMPLSSGAAQARRQEQARAFDRTMTERTFDPAELQRRGLPPEAAMPQPDVMAHGRQSLSDEYARLSAANALPSTPQLHHDLYGAQTNYERLALPSQRAGGARDIEALRNDIIDSLIAHGGAMPGDVYQATRSRLGNLAESAKNSDPTLANALRDMRGALDRGMQASLSPADAAAWALNNQRWGNMRTLEPAVASATENLSPARVAQVVRAGRAGQAAQGAGNLDEISRAANLLIRPMPSSGTAQRLGYQKLFDIPSALASAFTGAGAAGLGFGPLGVVAAAAAPHLAGRAVQSNIGQRYLANQVAPQNTRDLLAQILAQQAASQPSGIERNNAGQEAYRRASEQKLRDAGLQ